MVDRRHKELTHEDIKKISETYHTWRGELRDKKYQDISGFCKSASLEEIRKHEGILTPGRYVGAEGLEGDDTSLEEQISHLVSQVSEQFDKSRQLEEVIKKTIMNLGMASRFPKDYQFLPIKECVETIIDYRGKTPRKSKFGVPLITAKIVKNGRILKPEEYIPFEGYDAWMRRGIPRVGDVVITSEGPLGEVAQLNDDKVALAQRIIVLRGSDSLLNNDYLKFALQSPYVQNQIMSRSTGTTVHGIRQSELRNILIPVLPLPAQNTIANTLGSLDRKIELNYKMNDTLNSLIYLIFKLWFVEFEFPNIDGRPYKSQGGEMMHSELGQIPYGWQIGTLSSIINIHGGGTPRTNIPDYWNGDINWFTVKDCPNQGDVFVINTEKKISKVGLENSSTHILKKGTTIVTARGTVGKLALVGVPMAMNQTCYGISGKNGYNDYFVYCLLRFKIAELKMKTHGTIFDTITRETFNRIEIVIPPKEIANSFNQLVSATMDKILQQCFEVYTLTALRDILTPILFNETQNPERVSKDS